MPVIPQYNAGNPAQSRSPVLEATGQARANVGQSLDALGGLAAGLKNNFVALPNYDDNLGQAQYQGLDAIGQGIKRVGQSLFDIREREAEARNYADIHEAQVSMDIEAGKFDEWKLSADPRKWEEEWHNRSKQFFEGYFEGRDLSPSAQEGVRLRYDAFDSRQRVNVGVSAVKETTKRARESMYADYTRAVDAGDADTAIGLAGYGLQQGWIGPDDAVRLEINARDTVQAKQIEILSNERDAAIEYGDIDAARKAVDKMPIRDDERVLEMAHLEKRNGYRQLVEDAQDMIAISPQDALKEIEKSQFSGLRASDKAKLKDAANRVIHEERVFTLNGLKDEIRQGGISRLGEVAKRDDFKSLPTVWQNDLRQFAKDGALNDISEFATLQRSIRNYDPANDPRGFEKSEMERSIALRFDGAKADELAQVLTERSDPDAEPLSVSSRIVSDVFSRLQQRIDESGFGTFRFTGDQIKERKGEDGEISYAVPDKDGTPYNPWGPFGDRVEKAIRLSEKDVLRWKSGEKDDDDQYIDLNRKDVVYSKFFAVKEEIEERAGKGEFKSAEEMESAIRNLMGDEIMKSLESKLQFDKGGRNLPTSNLGTTSPALFPAQDMDALLKSTGY